MQMNDKTSFYNVLVCSSKAKVGREQKIGMQPKLVKADASIDDELRQAIDQIIAFICDSSSKASEIDQRIFYQGD